MSGDYYREPRESRMTEPKLELKSCPFCGSESVHIQNGAVAPGGHQYVLAWCANCGACSRDEVDVAQATAAWNTRASPTGYRRGNDGRRMV